MRRAAREYDRHTQTRTYVLTHKHTAQSISRGPTFQLRDKWCGVSAGFFVRSCAPCPPYVEQLSGGTLAPPPRGDEAEEGAPSAQDHIKI